MKVSRVVCVTKDMSAKAALTARTARTARARFEMPIAPVTITDRRAFARAVITGRAVTEFEPDGKAAEEVTALWQWIKETMA